MQNELESKLALIDEKLTEAQAALDRVSKVQFYDNDHRPKRSPGLAKLAAALARAQGQMINAEKDARGTYGAYATLAATWEVIRKPLADNEIAVYQRILMIAGKPTMATMLIHSSGEFIDDCELELKFDVNNRMNAMQAMGSAVTYARRYTLQAVTGVAPTDDDGESSGDKGQAEKQKSQAPKSSPPPPQAKKTEPGKAQAQPAKSQAAAKQAPPPPVKNEAKAQSKLSDAQIKTLKNLAPEKGWSNDQIKIFVKSAYGVESAAMIEPDQFEELSQIMATMSAEDALTMAQGQSQGGEA